MTSDQLVQRLHQCPNQLVLILTGGGSLIIPKLMAVPGASRTVLEITVPYAFRSLESLIGGGWEKSCSPQVARSLAMAAFQRALQLTSESESSLGGTPFAVEQLLGAACTAALATDRPKKGAHRVHVAIQTPDYTQSVSLELDKGSRSRETEEQLVSKLILNQIARACNIEESVDLGLNEKELISECLTLANPSWRTLVLGQQSLIAATPATLQTARPSVAIFPGAFNPRHEGHLRMAELAVQRLQTDIAFEISLTNVDKPELDYVELANRLKQFSDREAVWLTRAATFVEKAHLFPHATFVVGTDTIARIADPRYYASQRACQNAIQSITDQGCRFLVFGRRGDSQFQSLRDIALPSSLLRICEEIPEEEFRLDISSTELRAAAKRHKQR